MAHLFHSLIAKQDLPTELEEAKEQLRNDYDAMKAKKRFNHEEIEWLKEMARLNPDHVELVNKIDAAQRSFDRARQEKRIARQLTQLESQVGEKSIRKAAIKLARLVLKSPPAIRSNQLPEGFAKMDPIAQMKVLIPMAYPNLKFKTQHAFEESIDKLSKEQRAKLDQAVLKAQGKLAERKTSESDIAETAKKEEPTIKHAEPDETQQKNEEYDKLLKQFLDEEQVASPDKPKPTQQAPGNLRSVGKQGIEIPSKAIEHPATRITLSGEKKLDLPPPPTIVPSSALEPYTGELPPPPPLLEEPSTAEQLAREASQQTVTPSNAPPPPKAPPLLSKDKAQNKEEKYAQNIADGQTPTAARTLDEAVKKPRLRSAKARKPSEQEQILDQIKQGKLNSQSEEVKEAINKGILKQSDVEKAEKFYGKAHSESTDIPNALARAMEQRRRQIGEIEDKKKKPTETDSEEEKEWEL